MLINENRMTKNYQQSPRARVRLAILLAGPRFVAAPAAHAPLPPVVSAIERRNSASPETSTETSPTQNPLQSDNESGEPPRLSADEETPVPETFSQENSSDDTEATAPEILHPKEVRKVTFNKTVRQRFFQARRRDSPERVNVASLSFMQRFAFFHAKKAIRFLSCKAHQVVINKLSAKKL